MEVSCIVQKRLWPLVKGPAAEAFVGSLHWVENTLYMPFFYGKVKVAGQNLVEKSSNFLLTNGLMPCR